MTSLELKASLAAFVLGSTATGAAAFTQPVQVPLWFVLAGWILPTGELLIALRARLPGVNSDGSAKSEE